MNDKNNVMANEEKILEAFESHARAIDLLKEVSLGTNKTILRLIDIIEEMEDKIKQLENNFKL